MELRGKDGLERRLMTLENEDIKVEMYIYVEAGVRDRYLSFRNVKNELAEAEK